MLILAVEPSVCEWLQNLLRFLDLRRLCLCSITPFLFWYHKLVPDLQLFISVHACANSTLETNPIILQAIHFHRGLPTTCP